MAKVLNEIQAASLGNASVAQIYLGNTLIWPPVALTYIITAINALYNYGDKIYADGSNYYYATGTVKVMRGDTEVQTLTNVSLTPAISSANFFIADGHVKGYHLHKNTVTSSVSGIGYTATVNWTYLTSEPVQTVVKQSSNVGITHTEVNYTDCVVSLSPDPLPCTGTTITIDAYFTSTSTPVTIYTSGDVDRGAETPNLPTGTTPTNVTIYNPPVSGITWNGNTITVPVNSSFSARLYDIYMTFTDPLNGTWDKHDTVLHSENYYTYSTPIVTMTYPKIAGTNYHIPASGGTVSPSVSFTQYKTPQIGTAIVITGSVTGGATYGYDDVENKRFTVSYDGFSGNTRVTTGTVSCSSRKANYGDELTVRTNMIATVKSNNVEGSSSPQNVIQRENHIVQTDPGSVTYNSVSTYSIDGKSVVSASYVNLSRCTETVVAVVARASITTVTDKNYYTVWQETGSSDGISGGTRNTSTQNVSPTEVWVSTTGASGSYSKSQNSDPATFTATNIHSEAQKTYYIYVVYGTVNSSNNIKRAIQPADVIKTNGVGAYVVTLAKYGTDSIWAGGGSCQLIAYASHTTFSYWNSGGTSDVVPGSEQRINDNASVSGSGTGYQLGTRTIALDGNGYRYSLYTVQHNDMMNNGGSTSSVTNSVTYTAQNDTSPAASQPTVSWSVTNSLGSQTYITYTDWVTVSTFNNNYRVLSFSAARYTSSSDRAPFTGDPYTTYTVSAGHTLNGNQTRTKYTDRRYSSWSQAHDDDNHRYRVTDTTSSDTRQQIVLQQEVSGDPVTLEPQVSWLTVDTANSKINIANQNTSGGPRDGKVYAYNYTGNTKQGTYKEVRIYQLGYAFLMVQPTALVFPRSGGSKYVTIQYTRTNWTIHYQPLINQPGASFSTGSGGSQSGTGSTRVKVTLTAWSEDITGQGTVEVRPGVQGALTVSFTIAYENA